jgi:hypothetical protein
MNDLVIGILIIGLISALLLVGMLRLSKLLSSRLSNLLAIFVIALMLTYDLLIEDNVTLTHLLPFSNAIVLGNWVPLFVAMLAGLLWGRIVGSWLRRSFVIGSLVIVCLIATYRPILSAPPKMNDRWEMGVCLQTSQASCAPAAAATLLALHGIKTTEQEMALLCLTSERGTSMLGLWRGLKLETAGTDFDVYMFNDGTLDDLKRGEPVLISVELKQDSLAMAKYLTPKGWLLGVPHTVVVLGFRPDGRILVADPAIGIDDKPWTVDDLAVLWHGVGARLVRNKS